VPMTMPAARVSAALKTPVQIENFPVRSDAAGAGSTSSDAVAPDVQRIGE
jgi:hypothetical protein